MATENMARAQAATRSVLVNVKADQLDDPTPCASWNVRDLLNHMIGAQHFFAASTNAGEAPPPSDKDWTSGDMVADFDEGCRQSIAAFETPGALEKIVKLPFGDLPGAVFLSISTNDTFTHGWDLARATDQSADLDPELAAQILEGAKQLLSADFRGAEPMPFGPEQQAPAGATAADQLAAFMGRTV